MNSKSKTIFGILLFTIFLGGATLAYTYLSKQVQPENSLVQPGKSGQNEEGLSPPPQKENASEWLDGNSPNGSSSTKGELTPAAETPSGIATEDKTNDNEETEASDKEKLAAYDFTVYDTDRNPVKLSDFFGKPIIINFWATWCPHCVDEMPLFEEKFKEYGEDIQFLMIDSVDGVRETEEKGEQFIADNGFTFPVYYDTDGDAATVYAVYSLPTSVFIDKDGEVIAYQPGKLTEEMLKMGIDLIYTDNRE